MMYLNFKSSLLFISILGISSLISCTHKKSTSKNCTTCNHSTIGGAFNEGKTEKETAILRKYLKKAFSVDLNNEDIFIVIPDHPCEGCMYEAISIFKTYKKDGAKLIVTPAHSESLNTPDKNILIDSLGEINKLDLPFENASILLMRMGNIENMVYTTPDQDKNIRAMITKHLSAK